MTEAGSLVIYTSGINVDSGIVYKKDKSAFNWAYWLGDKKVLSFSPKLDYYTFVGPSVLGKWDD